MCYNAWAGLEKEASERAQIEGPESARCARNPDQIGVGPRPCDGSEAGATSPNNTALLRASGAHARRAATQSRPWRRLPRPGEASPPPAGATEDWATRYKYLFADFENFRRRTERGRESDHPSGEGRPASGSSCRIFEAFRFARGAVVNLPPNDPIRHGLELLDREWKTFLKHEGVEPIASVGQAFRAEEEEAVGEPLRRRRSPRERSRRSSSKGTDSLEEFSGRRRWSSPARRRTSAAEQSPRPEEAP